MSVQEERVRKGMGKTTNEDQTEKVESNLGMIMFIVQDNRSDDEYSGNRTNSYLVVDYLNPAHPTQVPGIKHPRIYQIGQHSIKL